jgi:hypothetical protein
LAAGAAVGDVGEEPGSAVMTRMRSADPNLAEEILFPREPAHDRTVVMADPGGPPIGIWR